MAQLVEALGYKPEGRGFDSRWCHWNFLYDMIYLLTAIWLSPGGSTHLHTNKT